MLHPTIATNVQNVASLHGHKPGDIVFIRQSPHQELSAVRQTTLHSDTVVLSNVSEIIQSGLLPFFCCKFFHQSVSSKILKLLPNTIVFAQAHFLDLLRLL